MAPALRDAAPTMGDTAYARLKSALLSNLHGDGERLDLAELARDHDISVTPIREAAVRLLGEGLLVTHPKGGFAVPRRTTQFLTDCLTLHQHLILLAIDRADRADGAPAKDRADLQDVAQSAWDIRPVFELIGTLCRSDPLRDAIARLDDHLQPLLLHEADVLAGGPAEAVALATSLADRQLPRLRALVRSYHRRRIGRAAQLLWTAAQRSRPPV